MLELQVAKREKVGSKPLRALRAEGVLPAIIYGKKEKSTPIQLSAHDFKKTFNQAGESTIITLTGLGENKEVLIYGVDFEPVKGEPLHVDFYAIEKDKKLEVDIPLEFVGVAPAVKELGGILVKVMHELTIEALPKDLPQEIEVDISPLVDFDTQIHVRDLRLPPGVTAVTHENEVVVMAEEAVEESFDEPAVGPDMSTIEVEKKGKEEEEGAPAAEAASE